MANQEHASPRMQQLMRAAEYISIILGIFSLAVAITSVIQRSLGEPETTIETRVETLSRSLENAASIVADIEREINSRMRLVSDLEERAHLAEQLQATNREQVEAISLLLRSELDRKENWNFWMNVTQNAMFMILGAFLGHFVERWMSRRRQPQTEAA